MQKKLNIAIDGYSSCGKSTIARDLARRLGYVYIDSGSMYRAVTLYCLEHDIDMADKEQIIAGLDHMQIQLDPTRDESVIYLNGENVASRIREMRVSEKVSEVSAIAEVRAKMVNIQRQYGKQGGVVMDGRDIGTVVFPDADIKIFMIADLQIRTRRRKLELEQRGLSITLEEITKNLRHRDHLDATRSASPLKKAEDAIVFNNSCLTEKQQIIWALNLVEVRLAN